MRSSVSAGDLVFVRRNQSQATELATTRGTGTRVRGAGTALGSAGSWPMTGTDFVADHPFAFFVVEERP
jgi:hypothetical protein